VLEKAKQQSSFFNFALLGEMGSVLRLRSVTREWVKTGREAEEMGSRGERTYISNLPCSPCPLLPRADSFPKRVKIARANPQLRPKILASSVRNT
jgi:hypothetical protein